MPEIPLQPGDIARRCPVRAQLDHTPQLRGERLPISEAQKDQVAALRSLRREVIETMAETRSVIDLTAERGRSDATMEALAREPDVVAAGRLPDDRVGHRTGGFDLLVRTSSPSGLAAWAPVVVRRHGLSTPGDPAHGELRSSLPDPDPARAQPDPGVRFRRNPLDRDARDLAHQWRMLEAAGIVTPGQRPLAGVVDRRLHLWWLDLGDPIWSTMWSTRPVSSLQRYDRAFANRLEVIERALERQRDPSLERLVTPIRVSECDRCPWDAVCTRELEATDHLSLLPRTSFRQVVEHRERGVRTRTQVARLDWFTAKVLATANESDARLDVSDLCRRLDELAPDEPLSSWITAVHPHRFGRRGEVGAPSSPELASRSSVEPSPDRDLLAHVGQAPVDLTTDLVDLDAEPSDSVETGSQDPPEAPWSPDGARLRGEWSEPSVPPVLALLAAHGITRVGDLHHLDPMTLTYGGIATHALPDAIDQARAAVSGRAFRARDLPQIVVPRADVEVDVDMENVEDGVYLWGTLVTLRDRGLEKTVELGIDPGYRPFLSWEAMSSQTAAEVFVAFWAWLSDLRQTCARNDLTFAAYCYTRAEEEKMRQIVAGAPGHPGLPTQEEITELTGSPEWVDLFRVAKTSLVTGQRMGLKRLAPLAGFAWRDDDPGGLQSMYWHRVATTDPDPLARARHRARVLAYNEDDVEATLAVREWLDHTDLPAIESWTPAAISRSSPTADDGSAGYTRPDGEAVVEP